MPSPLRFTWTVCVVLPFVAACDSVGAPTEYDAAVLSVSEITYDDRGMPGLAFEVENTGALPLYFLSVIVRPEPELSPNNDVAHEAQLTSPVESGRVTTIEVALPSRASHDDYDCYRYVVTGSDGDMTPGRGPVEFYLEDPGTCR